MDIELLIRITDKNIKTVEKDIRRSNDDMMKEYYSKMIKLYTVEKLILNNVIVRKDSLFIKLSEKYSETTSELIELSNQLVSLRKITRNEQMNLLNNVMSQGRCVKRLCEDGSKGMKIQYIKATISV